MELQMGFFNIEQLRELLKSGDVSRCGIDPEAVRIGAGLLAEHYWRDQGGAPGGLTGTLNAQTVSWILSLEPGEQDAAMAAMLKTVAGTVVQYAPAPPRRYYPDPVRTPTPWPLATAVATSVRRSPTPWPAPSRCSGYPPYDPPSCGSR
jgi:hypothetical protein